MMTTQQTVQLQVGKPAPDFNMLSTKNLETLEERVTLA
ncbi:peroxiredoxin, partial [Mesorhizobium sp. M00.F.Ca.ET.186.01.1.1]